MKKYINGNFKYNGQDYFDGPKWNMSLKAAGSMRFRWNEYNQNRIDFLNSVRDEKNVAQLELIHSKDVYFIDSENELDHKQGDGILTLNKMLFPVITVADCVPIYIFDINSKAFGVLHSGWKGTGICGEAVKLLCSKFNSRPEDICVVIGPHIGSCCYSIDENRASYFTENFGASCVTPVSDGKFSLSLTKANLAVLAKAGVPEENILIFDECTCCSGEKYGSFRRETSVLPEDMDLEEKSKRFTVQAAWTSW